MKLYPANQFQNQLWISCQTYQEQPLFNISFCYDINGYLSVEKLRDSLLKITQKHAALRTGFILQDGILHQAILEKPLLDFDIINLSDHSYSKKELSKIQQDIFETPFILTNPGLAKYRVLKLSMNHFRLLFVWHHLIIDAYSVKTLLTELSQFYSDYSAESKKDDNEILLPLVASQKASLTYWENLLKNIEVSSLFQQGYLAKITKANRKRLCFNKTVSQQVIHFLQQESCTLFEFMSAVTCTMVYRYCLQNEIIIGYTINNRIISKAFKTVGFQVNKLPLKINIEDNSNFSLILANVKLRRKNDRQHQATFYTDILDLVRTQQPEIIDFFDIVVNQYTYLMDNLHFIGCKTHQIPIDEVYTSTPFTLMFDMLKNKLTLEIEYQVDRYDQAMITGIVESLNAIIQNVIVSPHTPIKALEITGINLNKTLTKLNNTSVKLPDEDITEVIRNCCNKYSDNISIIDNATHLSFKEVNQQSDVLASKLMQYNLQENHLVPIITDRAWQYIVAAIAVLKCGAGFVPISAENNLENLNLQLQLTKLNPIIIIVCISPELVVTQLGKLPFIDYSKKLLPLINTVSSTPQTTFCPSSAAYAIFTSGTTGDPKCVVNTRIGLLNRLIWMKKNLSVKQSDIICFKTPVTFDVSIWEILLAFTTGAQIIVTPPQKHTDISYIHEIIQKYNVTIIHFVPSMFFHFLQYIKLEKLDSLRHIICSGEELPNSVVDLFHIHFKSGYTTLHNYYGPAEAAIDVTAYTCSSTNNNKNTPIGRPIDNTHIELLDNNGRRAPLGALGEICIAGIGLAQGYHGVSQHSAFKFHPELLRMFYHTGDLASLSNTGYLYYHGRLDRQIKLHGQRIELQAMEEKILLFEEVKSVHILHKKFKTKQILIAFYVSFSGIPIDRILLETHLLQYFPRSYLPNNYILLSEIPLTRHGKIDNQALKKLIPTELDTFSPKDKIQGSASEIWCFILNVSHIEIDSHFFALGGDSLKVIQLAILIYEKLHISITADQILNHLDFKSFCELIEHHQEQEPSLSAPSLLEKKFPLSEQQWHVWQACQKSPESNVYHIPLLFNSIDAIDCDNFIIAANAILERHPFLTIKIEENDASLFQEICPDRKISVVFTEINLTALLQLGNIPFDLANELLIRCYINKFNDHFQILWVFHHLVIDEWSLQLFFDEFNCFYTKNIQKLGSAPDYSEYASIINKDVYGRKEKVGLTSTTKIPYDHVYPAIFSGNTLQNTISEALSNRINGITRELKISKFSFFITSFALLLSRITNDNNIVINTTIANRSTLTASKVISFMAKTIALNFDINEEMDLHGFLLTQSHNVQLQLRSPISNTLNICFVYLNQQSFNLNLGRKKIQPELVHLNTSKFDLTLYFYEKYDSLKIALEYDTSHYTSSTMKVLLSDYMTLLELLTKSSSDKLILDIYPSPQISYTPSLLEISLTNNLVVALTNTILSHNLTNKIALSDQHRKLTYGQLIEHAENLALELQDKVSPMDCIGFIQKNAIDSIICILAILMTNGIYVPISPQTPLQRRNLILKKARIQLLIVDQYLQENNDIQQILISDISKSSNIINKKLFLQSEASATAYILFTSGTTGEPKGVKVSHLNVIHLIEQSKKLLGLTVNDSWSLCHAITFDYATWEIWGALLTGATLTVTHIEQQQDPEKLVPWLSSQKTSIFSQTPTSFQQILATDCFSEWLKSNNLRYIVLGGEKFNPSLLQDFWDTFQQHGVKIINMFGTTECTVHSTFHILTETDLSENLSSPIGKPLPGMGTFILDRYRRIAAPMFLGELCIFGAGVSQGYNNTDADTSGAFSVFNINGINAITYRTGDQAIWKNDKFYYVSRKDRQVKIRGHRIELTEIEYYLKKIKGVSDIFVFPYEIKQRLVLVAAIAGTSLSNDEIIQFLKKFIPDYMIPAHFVLLNKIPMTLHNKFDTTKILDKINATVNNKHIKNENITNTEITLSVWQEVLHNRTLTQDDNFFSFGGDSIAVIQATSLLRKKNIQIQISDIYKKQTVRELVAHLPNSSIISEVSTELPLKLPMTPIGNWFFHHIQMNVHHWCQYITFELLTKTTSLDSLNRFTDYLWNRHGILHYSVDVNHKSWNILNDKHQSIHIVEKFLSHDQILLESMIRALAEEINLYEGPIMKIALIHTQSTQKLVFVIHHLYVDGLSWRYLQDDFNDFIQEKLSPLDNMIDTSFCTWSKGLLSKNHCKQWEIQNSYWQRLNAIPQPFDFTLLGESNSYSFQQIEKLLLPKSITEKLVAISTTNKLSLEALLLSAVANAVFSLSGKKEFSLDIESHGRHYHSSHLPPTLSMGWLTAIFPFTISESDSDIWKLAYIIKHNLDNLPHNGVGYLFNHFAETNKATVKRTKDICFNFLGHFNHDASNIQSQSEFTGLTSNPTNERPYIIELNIFILHEVTHIQIQYNSKLCEREFIFSFKEIINERIIQFINDKPPLLPASIYQNINYNLGPMQRNLLTIFNNKSLGLNFNIATWVFSGPLDILHYKKSWKVLHPFFDILNCCFISDKFEMQISGETKDYIHIHDWSEQTSLQQEQNWQNLIAVLKEKPLNMKRAPLLELYLIKTGTHCHKVIMKMHQLLLDGWSINYFFSHLMNYYLLNLLPDCKTTFCQLHDYFKWQNDFSPLVIRDAYWQNYKNKLTVFRHYDEPNRNCYGMHTLHIGEELHLKVSTLVKFTKLTINHFYLAVWSLIQYIFIKDTTLVIGVMDANRQLEEYPQKVPSIGMLSTLLPCVIECDLNQSFLDFWRYIQTRRLEISTFSASSLNEINVAIGQNIKGVPFDSIFNFQNYPQQNQLFEDMGDVQIQQLQVFEKAHVPLGLRVAPKKDNTELKLTYQTGSNSRQHPEKLLECICQFLEILVANIDTNLDSLHGKLTILLED